MASWAFRLARANGFQSPGDLFNQMRSRTPDLGRIDLGASGRSASALLMDLTGVERAAVERMHLAELLQAFGATDDRTGHPWIVDAGMHPKSPAGARHVVCPRCLAEGEFAYWRQAWRLAVTTHCPHHSCLLTGQCHHCGAAPLIAAGRASDLARCHACEQPYGPTRRSYFQAQDRWLAEHPLKMSSAEPSVPVAIPAAWWHGVHILLSVISKANRARKLLNAEWPLRHRKCLAKVADGTMPRFIDADLESRRSQLHLVAWLTSEWPSRFVRVMTQGGLSAVDLRHFEHATPFWISSVGESMLAKRRYQVNEAEVAEAIRVLSSSEHPISKMELKRVLNVTEAGAIDAALGFRAPRLSENELQRVLQIVEQRVNEAPVERAEWASWVRDAACLGVMLWTGCFPRHLKDLTLPQGRSLLAEMNARCRVLRAEQANNIHLPARWLSAYIERVRPAFLRPSSPSEQLFLTRFSVPYGGFGLASKVASILRTAGVRDWQRGAHLVVSARLECPPRTPGEEPGRTPLVRKCGPPPSADQSLGSQTLARQRASDSRSGLQA